MQLFRLGGVSGREAILTLRDHSLSLVMASRGSTPEFTETSSPKLNFHLYNHTHDLTPEGRRFGFRSSPHSNENQRSQFHKIAYM